MAEATKKGLGEHALYLVGVLAWLIPGAGHWYLGQRSRAKVIFIGVCVLFGLGIMLGSTEMIDPRRSLAWFCAQILTGLPAVLASLGQNPQAEIVSCRGLDWGQLYTGVAGLLNLLCILDALGRVPDAAAEQETSRA